MLSKLAAAVRRVFREQRRAAEHGLEGMSGFDALLARELAAAGLPLRRAREAAVEVNRASTARLRDGKAPAAVFGPARVERVATTEASYAASAKVIGVAVGQNQRLRWRTYPGSCDRCRRLNGRSVRAGATFAVQDGRAVHGPPLHPWCKCKLEVVWGR